MADFKIGYNEVPEIFFNGIRQKRLYLDNQDTPIWPYDDDGITLKYAITFDPQGGTVETSFNSGWERTTYGQLGPYLFPTPQKENENFYGWASSPEATVADILSSTVFTNDATIYAIWKSDSELNKYRLTITPEHESIYYGTSLTDTATGSAIEYTCTSLEEIISPVSFHIESDIFLNANDITGVGSHNYNNGARLIGWICYDGANLKNGQQIILPGITTAETLFGKKNPGDSANIFIYPIIDHYDSEELVNFAFYLMPDVPMSDWSSKSIVDTYSINKNILYISQRYGFYQPFAAFELRLYQEDNLIYTVSIETNKNVDSTIKEWYKSENITENPIYPESFIDCNDAIRQLLEESQIVMPNTIQDFFDEGYQIIGIFYNVCSKSDYIFPFSAFYKKQRAALYEGWYNEWGEQEESFPILKQCGGDGIEDIINDFSYGWSLFGGDFSLVSIFANIQAEENITCTFCTNPVIFRSDSEVCGISLSGASAEYSKEAQVNVLLETELE